MSKKIIILLLIVFTIFLKFATCATFTYNYRDLKTDDLVNKNYLVIYKCGITCESLEKKVVDKFSGEESNITFKIPLGDLFREYHATENCYLPKITEVTYYVQNGSGKIFLTRQQNCESTPSIEVESPIIPNTETEIKIKIPSAIASKYSEGKDTFIPPELEEFFSVETKVELLINGEIANSSQIKVPLSGKEIKFVQKFPEGTYNITVKTIVQDCKCKSSTEKTTSISNLLVQAPQEQKTCSDGTPINACSNKTRGMFCNENQELVWNCQICGCPQGQECQPDGKCKEVIIVEQKCQENWEIYERKDCINGTRQVIYIDTSGCCGTPPCINVTYEPCEEESQPQLQQENDTNGSQLPGIYPTKSWLEENGLYFVLAIIILVLLIGFTIYFLETHKPKILEKPKEKPEKKKKKEELIPVKVNDLLLSVIDSLEDDEQAICNVLLEGEGIRQNDLRLKLGMPKQKFEIAMQKLERRQIIKEREGPNPRIFFNDWLK